MFITIGVIALLAIGFGAGRVHHPANLKLVAVKAELAKIEGEILTNSKAVVARIKALL